MRAFLGGAIVLLLSILIIVVYNKQGKHCDLTQVHNQDFNQYFKIKTNYFDKLSHALQPMDNSAGSKSSIDACERSLWTATIPWGLMKSSSYVIYGGRGTGKSFILDCDLRRHIDKHLMILPNNIKVSNFVKSFEERSRLRMQQGSAPRTWNADDFASAMLSMAVETIVMSPEVSNYISRAQSLDLNLKMRIVDIVCLFFGAPAADPLPEFVNGLLGWTGYFSSDSPASLEAQATSEDWREYKVMEAAEAILIRTPNLKALNLLLDAHRKMKYPQVVDVSDPFALLTDLSKFTKTVSNRTPALVVDGLDENRHLNCNGSVVTLQTFINSVLDRRFVALAMGGVLDFFLSIPELPGISVPTLGTQKIPRIDLSFTPAQLGSYADFLLGIMRQEQDSSRCRSLPTFRELLNISHSDENLNYLSECGCVLRHPRDLNSFFQQLLIRFQTKLAGEKFQFVATKSDIEVACKSLATQQSQSKFSCDDNFM